MKKLSLLCFLSFFVGCGNYQVALVAGPTGAPGANGFNSLIALVSNPPSCANGGVTVLSGLDINRDNSLSANEVVVSSDVCNGLNAAPTAFTPTGLVNPCGDAPGIYDEVFIKLQNGTLIASFSDNASGQNTRFSVLVAGTYRTTDGDNCVFTTDSSGNITYESHHY